MSFQTTVTTTSNVKETLTLLAEDHSLATESLSFDLLAVNTYYRTSSAKKWILIDAKIRSQVLQVKYLAHKSITFKEQYKIKIFLKKSLSKECKPEFTLKSNKSQTKVMLFIKKTSKLSMHKACMQEFINEARRKLLLSNFILGLFTINLQKALQPAIDSYKKEGNFSKDLKILVSQALEPQTNHEQRRIFHYLQKAEDQRTAYEKGVDEGELILESRLPIITRGGRNCKGTYLPAYGPIISYNELYYYDETIKLITDDQSLKFYALKSGYVDLEDNHISISNTLSLKDAAFSTTGSITVGAHRDVDLKITSNDHHGDAINKGVDIDVSSLEVKGSVAGNTSLKAESVRIGAQTHKTTQIIADEASVYLHRGDLKTKDGHIAKLEQGTVVAETVTVEAMLGGEIRAKHAKVDLVRSNCKIYASDSIEIDQIRGHHNKFYIAPNKIEDQDALIQKLEKKLALMRSELKMQESNLQRHIFQYESNYAQIDDLKREVSNAIQKGLPQPEVLAIRIKQYGIDSKRLASLKETVTQLKEEEEEASFYLEKRRNIISYATIAFEGRWDGRQEIFYEHTDSPLIEKYIPEGHIDKIVYKDIDSDKLVKVFGSKKGN